MEIRVIRYLAGTGGDARGEQAVTLTMQGIQIDAGSALGRIVAATLEYWPEHAKMLRKSYAALSPGAIRHANNTANLIEKIAEGDLSKLLVGYKWMCGMIAEEELHFRRTGSYRNSSFAEVDAEVYQIEGLMSLYMDGLLISQALWPNHIMAGEFYADKFLAATKPGSRHLEVGPGHGLLLYMAARMPQMREVTGWDVSPTSLDRTATCLTRMRMIDRVKLEIADIGSPRGAGEKKFDNIVLSEVAEHLEDPASALRRLRDMLAHDGRIFVNVPVNAPTVDHIFLLRTPEEAVALVEGAGLRTEEVCLAPASGYSLEHARKNEATITCCIIARPG
jgi:2-polyprenyl-3-methyl-5-hydroxy-6-metoxy-1,4-benzoquinol methylase